MTGSFAPGAGSSKSRLRPSYGRQPKFAPRAVPWRAKSISSIASWPTSPMVRSPRRAIEREAPRVAQAVGVDLGQRAGAVDERVARGRGEGLAAVGPRLDAQDLAQRRAQVLRVAARAVLVVAATAVAGADVEEAVGAEGELAAVVVALRIVVDEDGAGAGGVGEVVALAMELDEVLLGVLAGVVDVEQPGARVVRREREAEQPLLATGRDPVADVEEGRRELASGADDVDPPALADDEDPPPVGRRRGDVERLVEAADLDELDATACSGGGRGTRGGGGGGVAGGRDRGAGAVTVAPAGDEGRGRDGGGQQHGAGRHRSRMPKATADPAG